MVPGISEILNFNGQTTRRRYSCLDTEAACIVLRRLCYPYRWYDLEFLFDCPSQDLSETFWQAIEDFQPHFEKLAESSPTDLIHDRVRDYTKCICDSGPAVPCCVGFMDCMQIFMKRPGGQNIVHQVSYTVDRRPHYLNYVTIVTLDGLVFFSSSLQDIKRHDMTLYRLSGLENMLSLSLHINRQQFSMCLLILHFSSDLEFIYITESLRQLPNWHSMLQ